VRDETSYNVGDGLSSQKHGWRFDGDVPVRFDVHVKKSIPSYADGHDIVIQSAQPHLTKDGICYELGCSTGTLTSKLAACASGKNTRIIGLDQIPGMLEIAGAKCAECSNVAFEQTDILEYPFLPSLVIVSYYTIQFIPIVKRSRLAAKIYDALEDRGIFLLFEKICFDNPVIEKKVTDKYYAFKKAQGFTEEEILSKADALKDILIPQTEEQNLKMLRNAGFSSVNILFSELCWQGYLARK